MLDSSTRHKRKGIASIVTRWIEQCRRSGYAAVEPDNLDSFTRSRHLLTRSDNLALARLLGRQAHTSGLAFAQKNLPGVTSRERERAGSTSLLPRSVRSIPSARPTPLCTGAMCSKLSTATTADGSSVERAICAEMRSLWFSVIVCSGD